MAMPPAVFGPGILIMTRTDVTPGIAINVGFVNDFSVDFAGNTKQLYGQNQFALVAARGTIKATGKMKNAVLSGLAMNALFYGNTFSTAAYSGGVGVLSWNIGSTFTTNSTGGTGQFQVGSSLTFDADLGVTYAILNSSLSGVPLQRVTTGSEAAGKYSITAGSPGLYNFADQGAAVKITYTQTGSTASSTLNQEALTVTNQAIGFTPTFQLDYWSNLNQPSFSPFAIRIFQCVAAKHVMAFKLEDFMLPEFDFDIFANNNNQIYDIITPSVS